MLQIVVLIREICLYSRHNHPWKLNSNSLCLIAVVNNLHSRRAVGVAEGGDVECSAVADSINTKGSFTNELLSKMRMRPKPLRGSYNLRRGVDVDERLIGVVLFSRAPPVQEPSNIAVAEAVADVVGPGDPVALVATWSVPVIVEVIEGTPLRLPGSEICIERRTWIRAVPMAGDKTQVFLLVVPLNSGQPLALSFPATPVAARDLRRQASFLQSWIEHFDEVGSLSAIRLHRRVRSREVWLIQEAYEINCYTLGFVVLDIFDNLIRVGLPPVS